MSNNKISVNDNVIRIARGMFTLPKNKRKPYVRFEIKPDSVGRCLYLRLLDEKEGKGKCAKLEKKGIYQSTVPFNLTGDVGTFNLIQMTIDGIEYYKIGERYAL